MEEGGEMDSFFFNSLGRSLGAKPVSANDRPSKFSIILRLFSSGGEKVFASHLLKQVGGTQRHACL